MVSVWRHTLLVSLLLLSCSTQEPLANIRSEALVQSGKRSSDTRGQEQSIGIGQMALSWEQDVGSAQSFDLYFVSDRSKSNSGRKMISRVATSGRIQSLKLTPQELQAAQKSAPVGNDFCFYVVAVSAGTESEPSDLACLSASEEQAN